MNPTDNHLIWLALAAVVLLVTLATWAKVNAFIALLAGALLVGAGAGQPLLTVAKSFQDGLGATLGNIAAVICLGAMLGRLLAESGGAVVLATKFNDFFGPQRVVACVVALGLVVGLATWYAVGLLLLLPIIVSLTKQSGRPFLQLALPLVVALSVMHGLTPPHPGPIVAIDALKANTGLVLLWAFVLGVPTVLIAGPLVSPWLAKFEPAHPPLLSELGKTDAAMNPPGFGLTLATVLLPVLLMLLATLADLLLPVGDSWRTAADFIGSPLMALVVAVLAASWSFGFRCGLNRARILKITEESVAMVGMSILLLGAAGGFGRVLRDAGVAQALGSLAQTWHLPLLVYGWMIAACIRVSVGSATVATTTAAGLVAPLLVPGSGVSPELLVIAIGFGSLICSHLNDSGFWITKDCLGLSVPQALRTFTVVETVVSVVGLGLVLLVDFFR